MLDLFKPVLTGDLATPIRERAVVQFDDPAALAASQMVVMPAAAGTVRGFSAGPTNGVDVAVIGKAAEVAINSRQPNPGVCRTELLMQFLRGQRAIAGAERREDRAALLGTTDIGTTDIGATGIGATDIGFANWGFVIGRHENDSRFTMIAAR
ncbi:MAG: hypothetical protein WAP35_02625 [Solirubrobacterales bacterium]